MFAALLFASCGGNEGAYSETEKKSQDSSDSKRHEDQFKDLEKQESQKTDDRNPKAGENSPVGDPSKETKVQPTPNGPVTTEMPSK